MYISELATSLLVALFSLVNVYISSVVHNKLFTLCCD